LNVTRIFSEKDGKICANLVSVRKRARKILSVNFFDPGIYGEAVALAEPEQRHAVGNFRAYALICQKGGFELRRRQSVEMGNSLALYAV